METFPMKEVICALLGLSILCLSAKLSYRLSYYSLIIGVVGGYFVALGIKLNNAHFVLFKNIVFPLWVNIVFWLFFLVLLPLVFFYADRYRYR